MKTENISFKIHSIKNLDAPYKYNMYSIIMQIKELPFKDLESWRNTINPKKYDKNITVVNDIKDTYNNNPKEFVLKNIGITVLASDISFNKVKKEVNIIFEITEDCNERYWILDWWNTFSTLFEEVINKENIQNNAYIKLEIITWIEDKNDLVNIVDSRNTFMTKQINNKF